MFSVYENSLISHISYPRHHGTVAQKIISPEDFSSAFAEISSWQVYEPTPLHSLKSLAVEMGIQKILLKDESRRFGLGSFKALGGAYAAAKVLQKELSLKLGKEIAMKSITSGQCQSLCSQYTLVAATDGNHGRSLAWGAQSFGANCQIYIHAGVSKGRAQAMEKYGAKVTQLPGDYDESVLAARQSALQNPNWFVISDTSWEGYTEIPRLVMAGYGVMVQEIADVTKDGLHPTHVILQGGVGGLAGAVSAALRQRWGEGSPRVIVVEPGSAACLFESAKRDKPTSVKVEEESIMAGLSCGEPSPLAWSILREETSDFLAIPDTLVAPTMRLLAKPVGSDPTIEAGESGVAGLAALIAICRQDRLREACGISANSRVLVFGTEGATDPELYRKFVSERN